MRVDFCTFTAVGGYEVTVNPSQVRYFACLDGKNTTMYFDNDQSVTVTASRQQVEDGLTINDN